MSELAGLAVVFAQVGLIAVGGVITVVPEIQRQVVDVHHWMDARSFGALFALAQAAPGPNMLVVTLVGWRVAGLAGALVSSLALVLPPAVLSYVVGSLWRRHRGRPLLAQVQSGLNAVTIGLIAAAAWLLAQSAAVSTGAAVLMVIATVVLTGTRLNPLWMLAAGALCGALGLI